jgi:putative chitinase
MSFNFDFSLEKLSRVVPNPYIEHWYEVFCQVLPDYDITTLNRVCSFIAQTAHESGNFRIIRENLNYRPETLVRQWPSHFPDMATAQRYAHNPQAIANRAYANKMGNGDEASGDGWRFCGRGLIQLTGRDNYQGFADSIETDINEIPDYLATFEGSVQGACWFWELRDLNPLADVENIVAITERINGGHIGLEERIKNYKLAMQVFGG